MLITKMNIILDTIPKVYDFSKIASKASTDVTLYQSRYTVDGRSILGIFSLDLLKPITVEFDATEKALYDFCKENTYGDGGVEVNEVCGR